jgi:histidinol-phosphate aminotransferase
MTLNRQQTDDLLRRGFSRRHLGRVAGLLTAGAALPFYNEFAMAQQDMSRRGGRGAMDPNAVRINQNENPMGPCKEGLEAITQIAPMGWRYNAGADSTNLARAISDTEDVPADHITVYAGSSDPLHRVSCAFTSPTSSWTMGNPGYNSGAPAFIGSKVVSVSLRDDFAHDGAAMYKADPNAGVYYICNPNNPSGTITPRADIDYLLEHKKKDAILVIDEAYIHFTDKAQSAADLVKAGKDVIVLRTFSKIYGMAGLRMGFAMGRPDLLGKLRQWGPGFSPMPLTSLACATASLRVKTLVAERRALNKSIREDTMAFLDKKGVKVVPSETNFFMMEVNRPGGEIANAMASNGVIIGRVWNAWPTKVRVTVGSREDMAAFKTAFSKVWS